MTDTLVTLSFTNNAIYDGAGVQVGTYTGSVNIDYAANTGVPTVLAGSSVTITPANGVSSFATTTFSYPDLTATGPIPSGFGYQYGLAASPGSTIVDNGNGTSTSAFPNGSFTLFYNNENPSLVGGGFTAPGATATFNTTTFQPVSHTGFSASTNSSGTPNPTIAQLITEPVQSTILSGTVCYAAGTLIRTPRGDVAVQDLRVGDLVVTASGEKRPIVWLGHTLVNCAARPNPREAWPVRIAADAFGPGKPSRDLYVSPAHSICVDCVGEVMIDAQRLVNGATITRAPVDEIDYWHVELERHDVLLANDLPAESYLAMGNREFFVDRAGVDRGSDYGDADFCRPRANDGPVLAAVRAQLEAQALRLGYRAEIDPEPRLVVDGVDVASIGAEGVAVFLAPKSAQDVRLVSSSFVPCDDLGLNDDARRLGLCVYGLSLSDGRVANQIALTDRALADGFFAEEGADGCDWRWTRGEMALPAALWRNFAGPQIVLHVAYEAKGRRGWRGPAARAARREAGPAEKLRLIG